MELRFGLLIGFCVAWTGCQSEVAVLGQASSGHDSNLVPSNIVAGVSIQGVTGTGIVEAGTTINAATSADILMSKEAWNGSGVKLAGTIANRGNLDLSNSWAGAGFYGPSPVNAPLASQICSGTNVLGIAGSANCAGIFLNMNSNAYRDQATAAVTQTAETTTYAGADFPAGYRDVPIILKDDNGFVDVGTPSSQVTFAARPAVSCGTSQNTVAGRIADCLSQNGVNASWDGAVKANVGQGLWKLVTRSAPSKEVWQDQRTGLLWSSPITNDNWCRAAGNAQSNDPSGYCNSVANQPNYPVAQSWCAEIGPTAMKEAAGSGESWLNGIYMSAKGGMGKTATASSPSVRWRLPTKYDFQMAEIDGVRFVLPGMADTGGSAAWSATVTTDTRSMAITFTGGGGFGNASFRNGSREVRCVGR